MTSEEIRILTDTAWFIALVFAPAAIGGILMLTRFYHGTREEIMKTLFAALLATALVGCSQSPSTIANSSHSSTSPISSTTAAKTGVPQSPVDKAAPCDEDVVRRATLNALGGKLDTELNSASDASEVTPRRLAKQRNKIACLREWARGVKDDCQRQQFNGWLDYYAKGADEAEENMNHEGRQGEYDAYLRNQAAEDERLRKYESTHKIPKPETKCYTSDEIPQPFTAMPPSPKPEGFEPEKPRLKI